LNENGTVNGEKAIGALNQSGLFDEANQLKDRMFKSYRAQQEKVQAQNKIDAEMAQVKGKFASAVLGSENKAEALTLGLTEALKRGVKFSPGLAKYMANDEELRDGRIPPAHERELKYLVDKSLTPEQRIARVKLINEGLSPEELQYKKDEMELKRYGLDIKKMGYEADEKKINAELKAMGDSGLDPEVSFKREEKLRSEFMNQNKDFQKVGDAYNRIQASVSDPSAAGDLALIFNYMKMLDPNSVVRESEFATAETAGSVPDRVIAKYNKVKAGQRLSPDQRADFVNRAKKLMEAGANGYDRSVKTYKKLSNQYGLDQSRVVIDIDRQGKDPKKIGKWEKVKD